MSKAGYFNQYESYITEKIFLTDETSQVENETVVLTGRYLAKTRPGKDTKENVI